MNLLWTIPLLTCLIISSVYAQKIRIPYSQNLTSRLIELGLDAFADFLATENPALLEEIGHRKDVTVWAPSNEAVERERGDMQLRKRDRKQAAKNSAQCTKTGPSPQRTIPFPVPGRKARRMFKRQTEEGSSFPDSNYETLKTFLDDSEYVNLGPGQTVRFSKNQGTPRDGDPNGISPVEIMTGLGDVFSAVRGPFKFGNGVIYEVNEFFTLPESFSETMEQVDIAKRFLTRVKKTHGKLHFMEETPAITIFVPIDEGHGTKVPSHWHKLNNDIRSHVIHYPDHYSLFLQDDLWPNTTISTMAGSGATIKVSLAEDGDLLVNCRRIVKPNVVTRNGVIHFIDGPLFGGCSD